ncbi:MAG: tRNA A37 threonylcarbamoyladenosine dehydratase [Paraglaciecola sp.]
MSNFNYENAFSRNIGWITRSEQQILRHKKVAIEECGGVGGIHLITLSRLVITNFSLSNFDEFEVHNFNRQPGAFMSTVGHAKCAVMERMAKDINHESNITTFPEGLFEHNIDAFLDGADIYVDNLDVYALEARKTVLKKCDEKGIPVVIAALLGMGVAFVFDPAR